MFAGTKAPFSFTSQTSICQDRCGKPSTSDGLSLQCGKKEPKSANVFNPCFVCMCRDGCGGLKRRVVVCNARSPSSLCALSTSCPASHRTEVGDSVERGLWEETVAPGALLRPGFAKGGKVEVDRGGAHT